MDRPKVSVIITVYNAEPYIEQCVRSLMEQTLDDVEYIFINDCSTDGSMPLLQRTIAHYPQRQPAIKIVSNDRNEGVARSRLTGVRHATGDYIVHCDSDDWMDIDMLETAYSTATAQDADVVLYDFVIEGSGSVPVSQPCELSGTGFARALLLGQRQGALWNHLVKAWHYRQAGLAWPTACMAEDLTLMVQFALSAQRLSCVAKPLYHYRTVATSASKSDTCEALTRQARDMEQNIRLIEPLLARHRSLRHCVTFRKFFTKRWVLPAVTSAGDCRLWLNLHSEINIKLLLCPLIGMKDKVTALLVMARVYPALKHLLKAKR